MAGHGGDRGIPSAFDCQRAARWYRLFSRRVQPRGRLRFAVSRSKRNSLVRVLSIALACFAAGFLIHWLVWRVRIPTRQTAWLLAIFSGTLAAALATAPWWPLAWRFANAWEVLHVVIFHVAAMLAYVVAYSAIEERSPSMTILSRVADAGSRGQSREELQALLVGVSPVEIRVAAMLRDGMIREEAGRLMLTAKGRTWAGTFTTWRRLLRFELGG